MRLWRRWLRCERHGSHSRCDIPTTSGPLRLAASTIGSLNSHLLVPQWFSVGLLVSEAFPTLPQPSLLIGSIGWVSIFARLSVCASGAFVVGELIQGLLIFNVSGYEPLNWHATMLYWMVLLVAMIVNILGIRVFPHIESAAFIFHICFFFVLLVPLVYLTPQSSAQLVFADFENAGGWESNGLSWCLGLLTSAWSFVGKNTAERSFSEPWTDDQ